MKIDVEKLEKVFLEERDLDSYLELVETVKRNMVHPEWLGDFSKEGYLEALKNGSKILLYKHNNQIIAAGMMIPATNKSLEKLLSSDLNFQEVIDYGPQMVHPNYIGNGLQNKIIEDLDLYSVRNGYIYVLATIHPDNVYSINNLIKKDFIKLSDVVLKRGPRSIYRKKLNKEI